MRKTIRGFGLAVLALGLMAMPIAASAADHDAAETAMLANKVRKELVMLPFYSVFDNFTYQIDGDKVILSGEVTRPTLKTSAERVVARIEGVNQVENNIEVLPLSSFDNRIRRGVLYAVYGHPVLNRYALQSTGPIHLIVNNGHVTLEGVVSREMEKNVAFIQANSVPGVFSVTNNLRVENPKS
ncbi:MAG: BON domain-containing protein [Bryobacterales bacterium]